MSTAELMAECSACAGDECADLTCPKSQRACGHHCNCVMIHDHCHWCDQEWGEDVSFDDMRLFLGKRAKVTLDYDDPKATVIGVLHRLTEDGEVHVRDDLGVMHYCWPCLHVEAASE